MIVRNLGRVDYGETYAQMKGFTAQRGDDVPDEIWLCEHDSVYTQGLSGKAMHVLSSNGIPVIQTDRGGQVTYHGRGQVVAYPLIDLRKKNYFVKEYVRRLEEAVLLTLDHWSIVGKRVVGAPGVYVSRPSELTPTDWHRGVSAVAHSFFGLAKIAALGVKVSRHCSYHGLALNVAMDLSPFDGINPCGYERLPVTDMHRCGVEASLAEVTVILMKHLQAVLADGL